MSFQVSNLGLFLMEVKPLFSNTVVKKTPIENLYQKHSTK